MSTLAWLWLFDPSYSAFNWILAQFDIAPFPVDRRDPAGRASRSSWSTSGSARHSS
jgi:ABC-type sugar transport system permease subunit